MISDQVSISTNERSRKEQSRHCALYTQGRRSRRTIEGDDYAFLLQPGEAYGDSNVNAVVKIPKQNFADQNGDVNPEVIALGAPVNMKNQEGKSFQGIVKEATEDTITVDFNHPMAGRTLHFSGTIIEVRSAREDELTKGFSSID